MTRENQVFVADVVVINSMQEMVASNVINWPIGAIVELSAIDKIRKYRGFHEGHHFISMAMEVHDTPKCDIDHFIREYAYLFHDRQLGGHLSLSFYIQFFRKHVNITF
jgi:antirestriction protein